MRTLMTVMSLCLMGMAALAQDAPTPPPLAPVCHDLARQFEPYLSDSAQPARDGLSALGILHDWHTYGCGSANALVEQAQRSRRLLR